MFARFVRALLASILFVSEIWSGSNNCIYMYHVFHWLEKKKDYQKNKTEKKNKKKKTCITAPILKPTSDQKPFLDSAVLSTMTILVKETQKLQSQSLCQNGQITVFHAFLVSFTWQRNHILLLSLAQQMLLEYKYTDCLEN